MYFLNEEERKHLLKGYLPKSRDIQISEELRGWNWNQPPLETIYDTKLALYEIAGKYCPTGRDTYLRRVEMVKAKPNDDMIQGTIFHTVLVDIIVKTKKLIYSKGIDNYSQVLKELQLPCYDVLEKHISNIDESKVDEIKNKINTIWQYEYNQIAGRIQSVLSRQPFIGEDSLVSLAVPVVVEQKLDGSFLGLSQHLSVDAFVLSEPMILDLKFGQPFDFHKLTTTGYALVMEAIFEFPVNIGCLVYAEFRNNRLIIKKDFHIIDDELRQWFIEERDDKMRMVYEEIDPGIAENCYTTCPYYNICHN